jgi:hypothetical protein
MNDKKARQEYRGILEPYFFIIERRSADDDVAGGFDIVYSSDSLIKVIQAWRKMSAELHPKRFIARSMFGGVVTAALADLDPLLRRINDS